MGQLKIHDNEQSKELKNKLKFFLYFWIMKIVLSYEYTFPEGNFKRQLEILLVNLKHQMPYKNLNVNMKT